MSTNHQMPAWLRDVYPEGMPAWLRDMFREDDGHALLLAALRGGGTGGHQATAAEKRAVYARFAAGRDAARSQPAVFGRVLATVRAPGEVSPFARQFYGAGS